MINKAVDWRDRIVKLQTETEHKEHVQEHIEILDYLIERSKKCDLLETRMEMPNRIEVSS